ncbi:MAG: cysteine dioxygenase family protein [Acidobacteriota bacterium]
MATTATTGGVSLCAKQLFGFDLPDLDPVRDRPFETLRGIGQQLTEAIGREAWCCLAPQLQFHRDGYRRVRLFRDDQWEALMLCWLPGQHTAIHDHGTSAGITYVLMGALHESRFEWAGEGTPLRPSGCGDLATGGLTYELSNTVHEIANETNAPAASLHLYSPPLETLGAYDLATGSRWDVDVADRPDVQVGGDPNIDPEASESSCADR